MLQTLSIKNNNNKNNQVHFIRQRTQHNIGYTCKTEDIHVPGSYFNNLILSLMFISAQFCVFCFTMILFIVLYILFPSSCTKVLKHLPKDGANLLVPKLKTSVVDLYRGISRLNGAQQKTYMLSISRSKFVKYTHLNIILNRLFPYT